MRGSCNYKNKNHKRSTGGEGRGVQKNQHGTGLSTTPLHTVNRDKNRAGGERRWDKRGKEGKRKVLLNRK